MPPSCAHSFYFFKNCISNQLSTGKLHHDFHNPPSKEEPDDYDDYFKEKDVLTLKDKVENAKQELRETHETGEMLKNLEKQQQERAAVGACVCVCCVFCCVVCFVVCFAVCFIACFVVCALP